MNTTYKYICFNCRVLTKKMEFKKLLAQRISHLKGKVCWICTIAARYKKNMFNKMQQKKSNEEHPN